MTRYLNTAMFSDVTVRYGPSGELQFKAHKIVLSAKIYWFQAAFTGGFSVSKVRVFSRAPLTA
jgi:hypothetical protein